MAVRLEANVEPIPGYRLLDRLGGGGFGEVWRAVAPGGMMKAIKFVYGDLSHAGGDGQRAEQELKAMKRVLQVRHPYILSLERFDIVDGQLMIVMELADRNLWDRYKECRTQGLPGIPRQELLRYMEETAEALDLMNQEYQLQHLDIKPQNLFLVHNHVKVADFGLVKDLEGSQASVTGGITPVYAAPETFDGKVSRFSDQYSFAIVYQELLTGVRPFSGANVRQLILQHLQSDPNVSPLAETEQPIIARALSKIPEERYASCRELVTALRGVPGGPVGLSPSKMGLPMPPSSQGTGIPAGFSTGSAPGLAPSAQPPTWHTPNTPSSGPVTANLRGPMPIPPSNQGSTQSLRALEPSVLQEVAEVLPAVETTGDGVLFPALLLGVGQLGLTVVQRIREQIHTRVAPLTQLSNIRSLILDSDPEVLRAAGRGRRDMPLSAGEVQIAPLHRPSHYLKARDGRLAMDSWLNNKTLYRIPRSQVTTGLRCLGRLAFVDNYRTIARRLQLELEVLNDLNTLKHAAELTQLGLRTSRPRVYLFASLAGGTGSGMLIDLAYTIRAILQQMGYELPDVVAILLAPAVESNRSRAQSLANSYATLRELAYYARPSTTFEAKYHERERGISDPNPPFSRLMILPLPDEGDEIAVGETMEMIAQLVQRELTTPFGKVADLTRAGLPAPEWICRGQYFSTFGLFQLTWPQQTTLNAVSRRLCVQLVQRWASKDSKPIRDMVREWVQEQWSIHELGGDMFIHRVQSALVKDLGRPADSLCAALVEPLKPPSMQGEVPRRGIGFRSQTVPALDSEQLHQVLEGLDAILGSPDEEAPAPEQPPQVPELLRAHADHLTNEWSQKLAELSVQLIEEPRFRLAGAEEAVRQMIAQVEQVLQNHEPLTADLTQKAHEAYLRLRALADPLKPGQKRPYLSGPEAFELLRAYPKWRLQSIILAHLAGTFLSLRGHLSDSLREMNFCRDRLTELQRLFEEVPPEEKAFSAQGAVLRESSIGRRLYVSGCRNLREAVEMNMKSMGPDQLLELDQRMEQMLKNRFTALVHVCLTNQNIIKDVFVAMHQTAYAYAAEVQPPMNAGDLFFEQYPEEEQCDTELAEFFDEAAPELVISMRKSFSGGPTPAEFCVVAVPPGESGSRFSEILTRVAAANEVQSADSPDDIIIYRERVNLPFSVLEQLGPTAHDAYLQMSGADLSPHARADVDFHSES
jgi:serine/threonine protein kinase